jgi:FKBP-type peptidyl-prolyl cis-trans isomerase
MRFRLLSAALLAVSLSTACMSSTEPVVVPTIETTGFAPALGVDLAASTKTASGLYYRDIQVGAGTTPLFTGQTVGVTYTGSLPNGTVFDYWPRAASDTAFTFKLGAGQVIAGWDEGLVGMRVGGKRQLIVPSNLAYGATEFRNQAGTIVIPRYSILVFTVTAVSAQ